jgi:hypothetical protein
MSGIHSKVFYNNRLSKVASLTLINSTKGSMVFLIEKRAVPGIAEKMDDLKESGVTSSFFSFAFFTASVPMVFAGRFEPDVLAIASGIFILLFWLMFRSKLSRE